MFEKVYKIIIENADALQAEKMAAYMQNQFSFAGIAKPKLSMLVRPVLKELSRKPIDWKFVFDLYSCEYREAQYVAIEYLKRHKNQLVPEDIDNLKTLVVHKSWWETVDTIDEFVGGLVAKDESLKDTMLEWANADNIWLRRVAIDFQQRYGENTDKELLEKIVVANLGSEEFFINKAIGWSLRDYAKVNPKWVDSFVEKHKEKMAPISIREALKRE